MADPVADGDADVGREVEEEAAEEAEEAVEGEVEEEAEEEGEEVQNVSTAELAVMVVALGFTVALFAFAGWHALADASTEPPTASVTDVATTTENATYYDVTLRNEGDAGFVSATVSVDCAAQSRTVTFENVPANAYRNATVRCPPAATDVNATVITWVPE